MADYFGMAARDARETFGPQRNGVEVMTLSMECPLCGGILETTDMRVSETYHPGYHVAGTELPRRERETVVAACTECEFIVDLRRPDGVPKTSAQLLHDVGVFVREANRR